MNQEPFKVYSWRWIVLSVFMLVNVTAQVLWICYAPVALTAAGVWGVKREQVDLLAGLFMLLYLPVAIPAAWAIDYFGFKKAVGVGAFLTGFFGLLRGIFPADYTLALIGTVGIAIGQPFLLSAFTKLAAAWFPQKHRATVSGVLFLGVFLGVGIGSALTPFLVERYQFAGMQLIYGIAAAAAALLFLIFARSEPPTPPGPAGNEGRALVLEGFKGMLRQREVYLLCLALFIGGGIVNSVVTLIDGLGQERGFTSEQGAALTILLLVAGVIGSLVLPVASDGWRRRKLIIAIAIFAGVPAIIGLALGHGFFFQAVCFFLLGFFITGITPVAYQYGAEITHPAPEGTSNGIFALAVQASGLLILLVSSLKGSFHDSYALPLTGLAVLFAISGLLFLSARESPEVRGGKISPTGQNCHLG